MMHHMQSEADLEPLLHLIVRAHTVRRAALRIGGSLVRGLLTSVPVPPTITITQRGGEASIATWGAERHEEDEQQQPLPSSAAATLRRRRRFPSRWG